MTERHIRMNILEAGADKAKATLDDLTLRAKRLEAENADFQITDTGLNRVKRIKDLRLFITINNIKT